jgi:hypothetical protein
MKKPKNKTGEGFGMLMDSFWEAPSWRAMSKGAMWLYFLLRRRYNHKNNNNGRIFLAQREAALLLNSHRDYIARWFRELQHFGFIIMTCAGRLGLEGKGRAPRWHLPEFPFEGNPPTRDFLTWNGSPFTWPTKVGHSQKTESRPTKAGHPGPQKRAIRNGAYGPQKRATSPAYKSRPVIEGALHKERGKRKRTRSGARRAEDGRRLPR